MTDKTTDQGLLTMDKNGNVKMAFGVFGILDGILDNISTQYNEAEKNASDEIKKLDNLYEQLKNIKPSGPDFQYTEATIDAIKKTLPVECIGTCPTGDIVENYSSSVGFDLVVADKNFNLKQVDTLSIIESRFKTLQTEQDDLITTLNKKVLDEYRNIKARVIYLEQARARLYQYQQLPNKIDSKASCTTPDNPKIPPGFEMAYGPAYTVLTKRHSFFSTPCASPSADETLIRVNKKNPTDSAFKTIPMAQLPVPNGILGDGAQSPDVYISRVKCSSIDDFFDPSSDKRLWKSKCLNNSIKPGMSGAPTTDEIKGTTKSPASPPTKIVIPTPSSLPEMNENVVVYKKTNDDSIETMPSQLLIDLYNGIVQMQVDFANQTVHATQLLFASQIMTNSIVARIKNTCSGGAVCNKTADPVYTASTQLQNQLNMSGPANLARLEWKG